MARDFDLISLDIESSGTDATTDALLSIGCVRLSDMQPFYAEIRHEKLFVTPEAMRVNGVDITKVDDGARSTPPEVDDQLSTWLRESSYYDGKRYRGIPMGLNVGTFDMRFVQKWLPITFRQFGYRSLDLNALIFAEAIRQGTGFDRLKKQAKEAGAKLADHYAPDRKAHDALWDAYSNIGMFSWVTGLEIPGGDAQVVCDADPNSGHNSSSPQ
jgi:hypothetical protein